MSEDNLMVEEEKENEKFDANSRGLNILSFILPIIGLIMYAVKFRTEPVKARGIIIWTGMGVLLNIILTAFFGHNLLDSVLGLFYQ
jgi:hypothetical protein